MFAARFAAFVLAATFAWAALAKISRFSGWREALRAYRLPAPVEPPALILVPATEAAIALLFIARLTDVAAVASVVLLATFSVVLYRTAQRSGSRLPCGCFGRTRERDVRVALARNAMLVVSAAWLLGRGESFAPWPPAPQGEEWFAAGLAALAAGLAVWVVTTFAGAAAQGRPR